MRGRLGAQVTGPVSKLAQPIGIRGDGVAPAEGRRRCDRP